MSRGIDYFALLTANDQGDVVCKLVSRGLSEQVIVGLTHWSVEQIRRAVAARVTAKPDAVA